MHSLTPLIGLSLILNGKINVNALKPCAHQRPTQLISEQ